MISRRSGVPEKEVLELFESFPVTAHQSEFYRSHMAQAVRQIGERDPKDVDILALTHCIASPLWTEDKDLRDVPDIVTVSTDDLCALIETS